MQYEIAHCRHATEGAVSRLWYTMSWLEEKALLWALDSPADPPPLPWQQGGAGGGAVARYIHNTTARSWDQTKRIGELDVYSTLQDWGRLLALESQVQVRAGWPIICSRVGRFKEARRVEIKGHTDEEETVSKIPFWYKHECTLCCHCEVETYLILTHWTLESLALKAAFSRPFLFSKSWDHRSVI